MSANATEYDAGMDDTGYVHGGPYDRGSADSYYGRGKNPHYYPHGTYNGKRVEEFEMTAKEIAEYHKGFDDNEADGNFKDWE